MANLPESAYLLALLNSGLAPRALAKRVIHRWAVAESRPLAELFTLPPVELATQLELNPAEAAQVLSCAERAPQQAARVAALEQLGGGVLTRLDVAYPETLTQRLPEERLPYALFYRGSLALLSEAKAAVIGATSPGPEALEMARDLGAQIPGSDYILAGGYERGVDRRALDGAREAEGYTVVMLPLGLERFEPFPQAWARSLQEEQLLVLSPYPLESAHTEALARARMPLLAAVSEALLLVAPEQTPEALWAGSPPPEPPPALLWQGSEGDAAQAWLQAGAIPFGAAAEAQDRLLRALGLLVDEDEPISTGPADSTPLLPEEPVTFPDAETAIDTLGKSGKVPEALARRLRQANWGKDEGNTTTR